MEDADTIPSRWRGRFRFEIIHLLYAVSLLAVALATFGPSGLAPALIALGVWAYVFASRSRTQALLVVCLFLLCGFCLFSLLLPSISTAREAARRMQCRNNLKQITLALYTYYDDFASFPPAYVADSQGRPLHSWRVLILPYLDQKPLYDKYDFSEPWNGPNNRQLARQFMPPAYRCPRDGTNDTSTSYVAIVGPDAGWRGSQPTLFRDYKDGTSNTLMLLEWEEEVNWMEPRDATVDEALQLLTQVDPLPDKPHRYENFFYVEYVGRNAAFADGHVQFLLLPLAKETATGLLNRSDGISPSEADTERPLASQRILKVGNCIRLGVFVLLALLPLPWVWLGKGAAAPNMEA